MKKIGRENKVKDEEIKAIKKRIDRGETLANILIEFGISRQAYYARIEKLGIKPKAKKRVDKLNEAKEKILKGKLKSIDNMYELAALLDINFEEVHRLVDIGKNVETNEKRMNYLKNKSPEKFQEAIIILITKYYKLNAIELIETLKNR